MITVRMELRGRVYYFKAENRADAEILMDALNETYPSAKVDFL